MKGLFITLEGGEGSGKTTVSHLVIQQLGHQGIEAVYTREPGGIPIAEKIREVILDPKHLEMDARTEALLYAAARRQHLVEKVVPALEAGKIVICDRFIDSSVAYQGHARQLGIEEIWDINQFATEGMLPDLTIFFDVDPEIGLGRICADANRHVDRLDLEGIGFHKNVYQGYQDQAARFPQRIKTVDASQTLEKVVDEVSKIIRCALK